MRKDGRRGKRGVGKDRRSNEEKALVRRKGGKKVKERKEEEVKGRPG